MYALTMSNVSRFKVITLDWATIAESSPVTSTHALYASWTSLAAFRLRNCVVLDKSGLSCSSVVTNAPQSTPPPNKNL